MSFGRRLDVRIRLPGEPLNVRAEAHLVGALVQRPVAASPVSFPQIGRVNGRRDKPRRPLH